MAGASLSGYRTAFSNVPSIPRPFAVIVATLPSRVRDERRSIRDLDARIRRRREEQRHDHGLAEQRQAQEDEGVAPAEALRRLPAFLSLGLGAAGAILRFHVQLLLVSMHEEPS